MNERDIIRAISPRLILVQLETVRCLVAGLEGEIATNGEPLPLSEEIQKIRAQLIELAAKVSSLTEMPAQRGSHQAGGKGLPDAS